MPKYHLRKLKRTSVGRVIPAFYDNLLDYGYVLEVSTFIGINPVNRAYVQEDNLDLTMLFPTKGEALDYAVKQMNCKDVVFSTNEEDEKNTMVAEIRDCPFFSQTALRVTMDY